MIRLSTVDRLLQLYHGPDRLSDVMRRSLEADDLESVLTEAHLASLDRRLYIVLEEIYRCTQNPKGNNEVVIDDGLYRTSRLPNEQVSIVDIKDINIV